MPFEGSWSFTELVQLYVDTETGNKGGIRQLVGE